MSAVIAPPPSTINDPPPAVVIDHLTKLFSRSDTKVSSLKEGVLGALARKNQRDVVTALDGLSLTISRGEVFGLIGPNGSGKSTLLKLIAEITQPTDGRLAINGRVLGLIELGAGFHPDLTGEENIRLQGSIYGLSAAQIQERLEPILAFAELADFRHMPVRHYSSGMFVRLGFAIAIHCEPDILLVDEVLSVGDQSFQERCMREIDRRRRLGLTIVLVTHFIEQAERLCDRIAWLDHGRLKQLGPVAEVIAAYYQDMLDNRYPATQGLLDAQAIAAGVPGRFGSGRAHIDRLRILDPAGRVRTHLPRGASLTLEIDYSAQPEVTEVDCVLLIVTIDGLLVTYTRAVDLGPPSRPVDGHGTIRLHLDSPPLLPGRYEMSVSLSAPDDTGNHYDVLYKLFYLAIQTEGDWDTLAPMNLEPTVEPLLPQS